MNDFVIITVNITTVTKEYQVQKGQKLHNKRAFKKKVDHTIHSLM